MLARAVISLVAIPLHCWISMFTVQPGYSFSKAAVTALETGVLISPVISHTVRCDCCGLLWAEAATPPPLSPITVRAMAVRAIKAFFTVRSLC